MPNGQKVLLFQVTQPAAFDKTAGQNIQAGINRDTFPQSAAAINFAAGFSVNAGY